MKKIYSLIAIIMATVLMFSSVSFVYAAEERELTNDEKAAFIVRDEWTGWVRDFTASLSELDRTATAKIYDDMDFYDMQYRFTEKYKKVPEYLDEEGKPTQKLKDMIKEKRKEINKRKTESSESGTGSYEMIDWTGVNATDWMAKLPDNRYLNDINIPGVENAGMILTEADATNGDTTDLQRAGHIAAYVRQGNSTDINLNAGYRAFDYGLSYTAISGSSGDTYSTYGYSYAATQALIHGNVYTRIGNSGGTWVATIAGKNHNLVREFQKMVLFLMNHPKETIVVTLRYVSGGSYTQMATLIKEMIEKQTYPYLIGGERVKLKDFVYTGRTFPKLKDVRGKIVIASRWNDLNIGLPFSNGNSTTSFTPSGNVVDGVSMYTENKEQQYTAEEKVSHVTNSLDTVTGKNISTNGKKGKNGAIVYTGGYKVDNNATTGLLVVKPTAVADSVNTAIKTYGFTQGKLIGMLMMEKVDSALAPIIFKTNP